MRTKSAVNGRLHGCIDRFGRERRKDEFYQDGCVFENRSRLLMSEDLKL